MQNLKIIDLIFYVIGWGIVPLILLGILHFCFISFPSNIKEKGDKISARAGAWAGFIVLIFYILVKGKGYDYTFEWEISFTEEMLALNAILTPAVAGIIVGFMLTLLFGISRQSRFIGLLFIAIVSSTSIFIYEYIFLSSNSFINDIFKINSRIPLMYGILGAIFGILLYQVVYPVIGSK